MFSKEALINQRSSKLNPSSKLEKYPVLLIRAPLNDLKYLYKIKKNMGCGTVLVISKPIEKILDQNRKQKKTMDKRIKNQVLRYFNRFTSKDRKYCYYIVFSRFGVLK